MMKKLITFFTVITMFSAVISCEKDAEIPPTMTLKTGENYTSEDATLPKGSSVTVGVVVEKTEDDLKTYNVSVAYDNATTTSTVENYSISGTEKSHYEKDVTLTLRNQAGIETYYFTITDTDGNIVKKSLTFTVE